MEYSAQFVTIQGAPLYVETRGEGAPVVLIHAGVADRRMWDPQWERLSDAFRLIRFDMRGWGRSAPPDGAFRHQDDVLGVLDHFGIDRAHVAGVSYGSRVALAFALAYPARVRSLVVGAPSLGSETSSAIDAFGESEDALLDAGNLEAATQLNVDFWVVGPKRTPEQVDEGIRRSVYDMQYEAFGVRTPPGFAPARLSFVPEDASALAMPVLIMAGDADADAVVHNARRLSAEIHHAQLLIRENVGHMVTMERPDEIEPLLREFWGSVRANAY